MSKIEVAIGGPGGLTGSHIQSKNNKAVTEILGDKLRAKHKNTPAHRRTSTYTAPDVPPESKLQKLQKALQKSTKHHTVRVARRADDPKSFNVHHIPHAEGHDDWWKSLSETEQRAYIKRHPGSQHKVGASTTMGKPTTFLDITETGGPLSEAEKAIVANLRSLAAVAEAKPVSKPRK